jgi:hypothetical protein
VPSVGLRALAKRLAQILEDDPAEAVREARKIEPEGSDRRHALSVRAAILVDGGAAARQRDAMEEGLAIFRDLQAGPPDPQNAYNLANALVLVSGTAPQTGDWVAHQECTREQRAEARRLYSQVGADTTLADNLRTQAWTNVARQFSCSYRIGEAHDARLAALAIDPSNGAAAGAAARDLIWLFGQGGCSDVTRIEAILLAKIAKRNADRTRAYLGHRGATELAALADELGEAAPRSEHTDPFVRWVERERLTLAPVVELVDPTLGKIDWLVLPDVLERVPGATPFVPPPLFAMFNLMKADFILARDMAWRAISLGGWPTTGSFADTLDFAAYGPATSALVLAHRTALDLLDKVAVTANHYFQLGVPPSRVYFGRIWRESGSKNAGGAPLAPRVERSIRDGAPALYGLVELAEDYDNEVGIYRPQKDLRNAGTHRFVALHDLGGETECRQAPEIEHHARDAFTANVLRALRMARSALQMLALAITQYERHLRRSVDEPVGVMLVPDHDSVRGLKAGLRTNAETPESDPDAADSERGPTELP